jgi:hypothetical protein
VPESWVGEEVLVFRVTLVRTSWCGVLEGLREDGVEIKLLDEGPAVFHPDLPEDVL